MWLSWSESAWSDYLYWQTQDKRTLKRINDAYPGHATFSVRWNRQTRTALT